MDEPLVVKNVSFKALGLSLTSKLDWSSSILSIAKTASEKMALLIRSIVVRDCIWEDGTINPPLDLTWSTFVISVLLLLNASWIWKTSWNWVYRVAGTTLATSAEPLTHYQGGVRLSLFYTHCFGTCSSEQNELASLPYSCGSFRAWTTPCFI